MLDILVTWHVTSVLSILSDPLHENPRKGVIVHTDLTGCVRGGLKERRMITRLACVRTVRLRESVRAAAKASSRVRGPSWRLRLTMGLMCYPSCSLIAGQSSRGLLQSVADWYGAWTAALRRQILVSKMSPLGITSVTIVALNHPRQAQKTPFWPNITPISRISNPEFTPTQFDTLFFCDRLLSQLLIYRCR